MYTYTYVYIAYCLYIYLFKLSNCNHLAKASASWLFVRQTVYLFINNLNLVENA